MKDKLDKLMSRAFGKPMYRLAMIILGFPTILVAFLAFLMNRGKDLQNTLQIWIRSERVQKKMGRWSGFARMPGII